LLTGVTKGSGATTDDALERRIRALQSDLNVTYSQILGSTDEGESELPLPDLHGRAAKLEREISELRLRAAAATSDLFAPPAPVDSPEYLPSEVTLLAYHVVDDEIVAFVVAEDSLRVVRNLGSAASVARLVQQLDVQWVERG
jgi:hypothetical protein